MSNAFRSHYGFDAFYCLSGHEGSHEKGGVEGEGGRFRRNHCVPMPVVDSIDELNALLEEWDDADDRRRVGNRTMSVGHDWAFERELLRPLPGEAFDTALTLTPRPQAVTSHRLPPSSGVSVSGGAYALVRVRKQGSAIGIRMS